MRLVNRGGAKDFRPTTLNVPASTNFSSPAYSVRIRVGESTWKRAAPDLTVARPAIPASVAVAARAGTTGSKSIRAVHTSIHRLDLP